MPIQRDPISTGGAGGWTPTGAGTIHEALADPSDAAFITCNDESMCEVELQPAENPNELDGTTVTVRVQKAVDITQTVELLVELYQDGTDLIDTWLFNVEDTWTDHVLAVANLHLVTNFETLSLQITDNASPLTATNNISRAYLTVPERRLHAHGCG